MATTAKNRALATDWRSWGARALQAAALLTAAAAMAGCDTARVAVGAAPGAAGGDASTASERACWSCHGTPGDAAPPRALERKGDQADRVATTDPGVGAHTAHMHAKLSSQITCDACHVVPAAVFVPGHMDGDDKATVTFGALALAGGATPTYDAAKGTCASSYCHGGTLKSNTQTNAAPLAAPKWTQVDGSFAACGACHGAPPAAPHPKGDDCGQCHAATVAIGQKITFTSKHIDGKVDVVLASNADCAACHGNPPPGPKHPAGAACNQCHASSIGADKLPIAGGAHRDGKVQVVLAEGASCSGCHGDPPPAPKHPANNKCSQCHAVTVDAAGKVLNSGMHMDGKVEIVLDKNVNCASCHGNPPGLTASGAKHPANKQCAQCHADSVAKDLQPIAGGAHMNGKVSVVFSADVDCGSCHGNPPALMASGAKHPISTKCGDCHADSIGADLMPLAGGKHMDGKIQMVLAATADCSGCHGNPPATPKHPIATDCKQCHVTSVDANNKPIAGGAHLDGKVQIAFSELVNCGSCHGNPPQTTTHPKDAANCGGCHAASIDDFKKPIAGGKHMDGNIQVVLGPSAKCGSCHGAPPATPTHPKTDKCSQCHAASVDANQKPVVGGKHMDGSLQVALTDGVDCGACHGNPPLLTSKGAKHTAMKACSKCHGSSVDAAGLLVAGGTHMSGKVDLQYPGNCWSCHGTEQSGGAPGPDLQGNTSPTSAKVGAHAAHVKGEQYSDGGLPCLACHEGPENIDSPGHFTGELGITFPGSFSAKGGKKPVYDPQTQSCSQTYCHSGALETGAAMAPKWTQTQLACNACHALPPASSTGHPSATNCTSCHSKTLKSDGTLDILGGFHINGSVP